MITFVTVNFNTTDLIDCLCCSLRKNHPDCKIVVFDNSNIDGLPERVRKKFSIEYYDNTHGEILNFDEIISKTRMPVNQRVMAQNSLGSCKHCITIEWLLTNLPYDDIVLLDSDILLKRPIDFIDQAKISIGLLNDSERSKNTKRRCRILPFVQYFNLRLIKKLGIRFFDPTRMVGLGSDSDTIYDTGASFYEDAISLNPEYVDTTCNIFEYAKHMNSGSWAGDNVNNWLYENRNLWNMEPTSVIGTKKGVISLTTWPARIGMVGCTIFTLVKNCPGFHVVLCLSSEEFPNRERDLPNDLLLMLRAGVFELLWTDENLRPHNKYYFTMIKYRNMPIITVDDDQLIIDNIAEKLYQSYIKHPKAIHAGRCHEIQYDADGKALPYDKWIYCQTRKHEASKDLFATGVGGVLYPPNILRLDSTCIPVIKDIITADDIYLKVRENELNVNIIWVPGIHFIDQSAPNGLALHNNLGEHLNDKYIEKYL